MSVTAIILGRAGSKGVPGKNLRPIAGRPCSQWTIEHALASDTIDRVIVSSDADDLLALANSLGVDAVRRPGELATDSARIDDAARHAAKSVESDLLVILYANVPVRPADLTDRAVQLLVSSGCDSVQSYARVGKHHPWWTCRVSENGAVLPWEGDVLYHGVFRRQDLPPAHVPDGGVIALTRNALMNPGDGPHGFLGADRRGIETNEGDVIDIDLPIDLAVAEAVLSERSHAHR